MEIHGVAIPIKDSKITKLRYDLTRAIKFNKESVFRKLIDDSDVSSCRSALESYDSASDCMSPFEVASCGRANRTNFIRQCISIGCDANKQNPKCGRRPVSFAIQQFNYYNLEALLSDTNVRVDFEYSFDFRFTPINYLLKQISDELYEFKENCLCLELLVKHGADVNAPGIDGKTPIQNILEKKNLNDMRKRILVHCIFDHAKYIDINDENGAVRTQLNELMVDLKLSTVEREQSLNVAHVERCLKDFDGNETEFWKSFKMNEKDQSYWHSALDYAVRRGLIYSVERIFRSGFIKTFHSLDECKEPLLTSAIRSIGWDHDANIEKGLNLFLNHREVDVNSTDKFGFTALFTSIKSFKSNVTTKLLEHGAYLGMKSKWGDMVLTDIKPEVLEKHFDNCITTDGKAINNEYLEVTFDYKNLILLHSKISPSERLTKYCEMKAIECILETSALRHLIKHPLVESFIDLKWNRLASIFYTNFSFCALFAVLNIFYILFFFLDHIDSTVSMTLCQLILLFAMITRETIQIICSPYNYFRRYQNYVECTLIGLVMFILFGNCPVKWRGTVAAVTILLIAYEISDLIGSLPIRSFAMHYVMLETVATNFFKSLLFYSTIIVAFALAFLSLFHKPSSHLQAKESNETVDDEQKYNNFQSFGLSMLKSIVMANGELDASSINFDENALSYIIFVAFIFLVTTVLANLLSGLAVSDINEIRCQAQWTHLVRRCEVLARYEKIFQDERSWLIWFPKLVHFLRSIICLYPDFRSEYQIKINPNKRKERNFKKIVGSWLKCIKSAFFFDSHHLIDGDIIKEALKRVNLKLSEENDIEMFRNQISKISDSNDSIQFRIDSIEKIVKSIEKALETQNSNETKSPCNVAP